MYGKYGHRLAVRSNVMNVAKKQWQFYLPIHAHGTAAHVLANTGRIENNPYSQMVDNKPSLLQISGQETDAPPQRNSGNRPSRHDGPCLMFHHVHL
jgi:hypothetical protein